MCRPTSIHWLLLILGGCACLAHATEAGPKVWVTAEDEEVSKLAKEEQDLYCNGAEVGANDFTSLNLGHRKGDLEGALGGQNVITDVFTSAKTSDDISDVFMTKYGTGWFINRAMAFIFSGIVMCIAFVFCCCSRCTCRSEEQPTSRKWKIVAAVVIGIVLLGVLICTITSFDGFNEASKGGKNAQCTSIQFLATSLNGQYNHEPKFVGLLPLLKDLKEADEALDVDGNHGLSRDIEKILEKTDDIKQLTDLAQETLKLLKETMALNLEPKNANGDTMFHDCLLCKVLQDQATTALETIKTSTANKLAMAREDIKKKTTPEYKAQMHKDLEDIRKSVVKHKDSMRDGVKRMLDKDSAYRQFAEKEKLVESLLLGIVIAGTVFAILLGICAATSTWKFTFNEMDPELEERNENPYNPRIYWYAGSTWCYGFYYMVILLALAGLIFGTTAIGSGVCLVINDLDANSLNAMGPALGLGGANATQKDKDELEVMKGVVDKCLKPPEGQQGVKQYLLDIIYTRDEQNNKVTLREQLLRSEDNSKAIFAQITENVQTTYVPLATNPDIQKLLQATKEYTVRQMLVGNFDDITDDQLRGLGDLRLDAALKSVLACSMDCADKVIGTDMGAESQKTMIGIEAFSSALSSLGSPLPAKHGCMKKVTCKSGLAVHTKAACKSANVYLGIKEKLLDEVDTFRCDLFEKPGSPSVSCDPLNMVCSTTPAPAPIGEGRRLEGSMAMLAFDSNQNTSRRLEGSIAPPPGTQTCTGVCVDADGKAKILEKTCKLVEFNTYVSNFHGRLDKLIKLIDDTVAGHRPSIKSSIDFLLLTHGASKAQGIANSVTCNFLGQYYQDFLDGACYQGIWGARKVAKSYVWTSVLTGFLVIVMYAVWCRSKVNHEKWDPDRSKYQAKKEALDKPKKNTPEEGDFLLGGREVQAPTQVGPPKTKFSGMPDEEAAGDE